MTTPVKREELRVSLEDLIDGYSDMQGMISDLAIICYEKANHLIDNWQDKVGADKWERLGDLFESLEVNRQG